MRFKKRLDHIAFKSSVRVDMFPSFSKYKDYTYNSDLNWKYQYG